MSFEIDPREVLEHLEYLGYTSITKDQLSDFIRDLKKLIKHEQSKEKKGRIAPEVQDKVSVACETSLPFESRSVNTGHEAAPSLVHEENYSTLHHYPPVTKPGTPNLQRSYHSEDYDLQSKPLVIDHISCCKQCEKKNCFKTCGMKDCLETEKQPCPSFIRPGVCKPAKCDPVALYHYYQTQWSKKPLPGEDPRTDLRWAVRTRLAQKQHQQQELQQSRKDVKAEQSLLVDKWNKQINIIITFSKPLSK
ncbi:uncharacterized protein Hyls1 isoform X2 [Halyomorpha halys]|uniref:uncharacterized protein Hyls1 isoform X2 n=1 Tax=Halyomorpha halys TaxID=286706 RepID=UPI0006D52634|nr:uncharacterized protein LOC106677448 isoform X2 [Halyomorpha halys]